VKIRPEPRSDILEPLTESRGSRPCLTENLTSAFTAAGASAGDAESATATLDPTVLNQLPDPVRDQVVTAYADALAPVFWYLLPFIGVAFLLSLFLKQIPLSDVAGLVARGEAIGGEEAERREAETRAARTATPSDTTSENIG
jgi:hypothetical protein